MDQTTTDISKYFGIKYYDLIQEYQVSCPYVENHKEDDKHKSASINFKKKLFYCFTCTQGKTFEQLYNEKINNVSTVGTELHNSNSNSNNITNLLSFSMDGNQTKKQVNPNFQLQLADLIATQTQTQRIRQVIPKEKCIKYALQSITTKGIPIELLDTLKAIPVLNVDEPYYGYIKFPTDNNGSFVARKYLPDDILQGERYLLSAGNRPLVGNINEQTEEYIFVEGYLDYISLKYILTYNNTICNLSLALNPERAYKFKGKIVFILFDNDYAGFEAAQKASRVFRQIGAYPIVLDLPDKFGKDPNDAIHYHKDEFKVWLDTHIKQSSATDTNYIENFGSETSLYTLKSGIEILDNHLFNGGYSVGLHAWAAKPGVGKTAWGLFLAHNLVIYNDYIPKILYLSYEIPQKQCWARLAAIYDIARPWNEIEKNSTMSEEAKRMMLKLSQNIRIAINWDVSEIARAAVNYDAIFIDYIQRMPGNHSDEKVNVSHNIKALSKIMMEKNKIIFVISSIPRSSYDKEDLSIFKESGDIEFAIQSAMLLNDINKGGEHRLIKFTMLKNTRGGIGESYWMEGNMLHNTFKEIIPDI